MASRASKSPSLIPLPVRNPSIPPAGPHVTAIYVKDLADEQAKHKKENGNVNNEKQADIQSPQNTSGKGFETFLMTGDMIIRTNSPVTPKHMRSRSEIKSQESHIPRFSLIDQKLHQQKVSKPQQEGTITSPKLTSKIPGPIKNLSNHNHLSSSTEMAPALNQFKDFPLVQAPVAEMEELSDLSQSSCSEGEMGINYHSPTVPLSLPELHNSLPFDNGSLRLGETAETLQSLNKASDALYSEPLSSGDSGFTHESHISESNFVSDETLTDKEDSTEYSTHNIGLKDIQRPIVASSSGEKFSVHTGGDRLLVRPSKSHENYLQAGTGIALVNIDIEDNLAYSLDTLTYHDSPNSSLDNVSSELVQTSRSLNNSPEKKEKSAVERDFLTEDTKPIKLKLVKKEEAMLNHNHSDYQQYEANNSGNFNSTHYQNSPEFISTGRFKEEDKSGGDGSTIETGYNDPFLMSVLSEDSDTDSLYHQPSKAVDRPSAERLAKRLFYLEGFRKCDVSRHLCKKNDFSNLVAEEYLKYFEFNEDTLDQALRKFLKQFSLYGETQERERVLAHFSRRFMECNPGSFKSEDACHTLTCAIMLLNSDLHAPNVGRRMTCQEFIENLAELNDGDNFSKEVLRAIYQAIKNEPIEWAVDDLPVDLEGIQIQESAQSVPTPLPAALGSNPFLEVPDPNKTSEYKKGYVMRKCCMEPDRRKTPFGKRGWKMLYTVLRDMILYQYKDEHQLKKGHFVESSHNAIRIHHALATKATDYTKKQHVFRLQTADGAEYLFQTGDSKELQEWLDTINLVAASLSAPPLPGAVGSKSKFQRQLLPAAYTRLNLREQLHSHETKVQDLEQELHIHRAAAPEKGAKSSVIQDYLDKEIYLEYELKRFKTYSYLLLGKLSAFPELEPSLVETTIGEYEEMGAGPSRAMPLPSTGVKSQGGVAKPVQRSLSDSHPADLEGTPPLRRAPVVNTLTECTKM